MLITLLVYWVAEEYAELLGEQVTGGHLPTWAYIRAALAHTWPMVSASYLPLLALVLTRVAGASAYSSATQYTRSVTRTEMASARVGSLPPAAAMIAAVMMAP